MYSPAALSTSFSKPLFLVYQLLRLSRDLYDQGLALGEITLGDILLMDNFTIQVILETTPCMLQLLIKDKFLNMFFRPLGDAKAERQYLFEIRIGQR